MGVQDAKMYLRADSTLQNVVDRGVDEAIAEKSSSRKCQWVHLQIPISGVNPRYKAIYA